MLWKVRKMFKEPEMLSYKSGSHMDGVVNKTPFLRIHVTPSQGLVSFLRQQAIRVVSGRIWSLNLRSLNHSDSTELLFCIHALI